MGIIRIWGKRRTEGVEKCKSKSVFEQFPQVTEHVKTLHFKANCMDILK
jgi:hypothetical protein